LVLSQNTLGQASAKIQSDITQAFIGFFCVNLFDLLDGFKFGAFNDRQAKSLHISKLMESFCVEGLLHCHHETAIPIGLQ
jgi:hypothetical protein